MRLRLPSNRETTASIDDGVLTATPGDGRAPRAGRRDGAVAWSGDCRKALSWKDPEEDLEVGVSPRGRPGGDALQRPQVGERLGVASVEGARACAGRRAAPGGSPRGPR